MSVVIGRVTGAHVDPQLRGKVQVAGERWLVLRNEDEPAVRRGLRRLGHILPPQPG
jgi:hypothetical protein